MTAPATDGATDVQENTPRKPRRFPGEDVLCLLITAMVGAAVVWPILGLYEKRLAPDTASYFDLFNVSAMMGTGHGFVEGAEENYPELAAFLHGETQYLAPRVLDASAVRPVTDPTFLSHYYLVKSLGCWWRLFGVSIPAFLAFMGLLYALCAMVVYGLFRIGCGRLMSLLGSACMITSPAWLIVAPCPRDFAKANFVLAFLALAAWAARRRFSGGVMVAWSLLAGAVLGVGWGFRSDLFVCVPPALLLPWLVRLDGERSWRWRAASCLVLLMTLAVVGSPIILGTRHNNGVFYLHTMMQGLSERSESAMSFGDASYVQYKDWLDPSSYGVAAAYDARHGGSPSPDFPDSMPYLDSVRQYVTESMRTFPADFFRRGLASFYAVSTVTADACRDASLPGVGPAPVFDFWKHLHRPIAEHMETFGMLYVLLALAVGFALDFRAAAILAVLAVYIGAYPSLLYQTRHYFHLSFLPYWALAWLLTVLGRTLLLRIRGGRGRIPVRAAALGIASAVAFVALLAGTARLLDLVQHGAVKQLQDQYRRASLEAVPCREVPDTDGWVLLEPLAPIPGLGREEEATTFGTAQALLAMQLDWAPPVFPVKMVYEGGFTVDFSQEIYPLVENQSKEAPLTCFLPVLELNWPEAKTIGEHGEGKAQRGHFVGIAVPESRRDRVRGLFRVANAAEFSLQLFATLPDDPSRFLAAKSGPWAKQWDVCRAGWGGTPDKSVAGLCAAAQRYPYDARVRGALEAFLQSHHDPPVWDQAWPIIASLNPGRCMEAGLALDRLAEERLDAGDTQAAVELYRTAATVAPRAQWHKTVLAKVYERLGQKADALAQYLDVLAQEPETPGLAEHVDQMYDAEKDTAGRLEAWLALCRQHPSAFVPAHHLALAYAATGDVDKALSEHGRAYGISPEHPAQLMDYGRTLLGSGQWPRAVEMFRKAAAANATLAPTAADLCAKAARDRLQAGDAQMAVWLFMQAVELRPDDRPLRIETAAARKTAGDPEGALETLTALMAQAPDEYVALQMDQMLESMSSAPEERVSRWRALATEHPECVDCRVHLGMALEKAGKPEEAQREYEGVLEKDTGRQLARLRLGTIMAAYGREAEGLALVDQAVGADPSLAQFGGRAYAEVAARKASGDDLPRAEQLYRRTLVLDPNDAWSAVRLGEVLTKAGRPDEAAAQYGGLLQVMPESPYCAARLDELLAAGAPEKRLDSWRELTDAHPDAATPRFYLGRALESLGKWEGAAAAYREALKINPGLLQARIAGVILKVSSGNAAEGIQELQSMAQDAGLPKEGIIAAFDQAARHLLERGDTRTALDVYRNGLAAFADAPPLLFGQSEALEQAGDRAGALEVCVRLLAVLPESPKTAERLDALCKASNPGATACMDLWKRIVQTHPDAAIPQLHLGLALEAAGDVAGAEAAYRQALSRDPKPDVDSALFKKVKEGGFEVK